MIYIGNHLSSSKGYLAMGKAATKLGGDTFAFFTRNPRGGKAKDIDPADAAALMTYLKEHNFGRIVAHAPYTMNLCSDKADIREFALNMLKDDLKRMEYTPGQYYNFHPGSHVGQGVETGVGMIARALDEAMFDEMTTTVLLETMAGKGSEIGGAFEELRMIIDAVSDSTREHLGVCLDTCHIWDGGYDIVESLDAVLDEFDRVIGLDRLKAIHINDTLNPLAAHKDRHAKIGEGHIGNEAFEKIVTNPRVQGLPFILETPNDDEGYAREIALIRSWMK
ncbi:MAG: deoxyribonuclease IV [Clostridiales bacterium]|nr:deoxyribonuclease IV [Candidatus Crickella merdequi]